MSFYTREQLVEIRRSTCCNAAALQQVPEEVRRSPEPVLQSSTAATENTSPTTLTYSRLALLEIRQATAGRTPLSTLSSTEITLPASIRRQQQQYTRQRLLEIRQQQQLQPTAVAVPDELKRPTTRFRCESDCQDEQQHRIKQVLKYTRQQLVLLRQNVAPPPTANSGSEGAEEAKRAQTKAPEIFRRSLGR